MPSTTSLAPSGFFKQRQRWDGDLYYLYVRKHAMSFNPDLLGWRNVILQVWTGLFFQLVMPFIILVYSFFIFLIYPPGFVLGVWLMIYLLYVLISIVFFVVHITFISERRAEDIRLCWLLFVLPLFTFSQRVANALATLKEMSSQSHLDSSMAPWWVLRKSKF